MRRSARLLALIVLGLALLLPTPAYAERTLALSSGSFRFDVSPGKGGKGEVVVINDGDETINVLVYVADQTVDETGKVDFVTPNRDNLQQSLMGPSGWVRIEMPERSKAIGNTPYIVLEPGQRVPVKFSFEVPAETPSGDHNTILFFEMFSFESGEQGMTSKVHGRVGSRLKVRVAGSIIERLDAAPFWAKSFVTGQEVPFRFTVRNDGNIDKRVNASISLIDRTDAVKFRSDVVTDAAVYAGTQRQITGDAVPGGLLVGPFKVRLTIDYAKESGEGGLGSIVKERTVWIVPMWLAITAAGLLVLGAVSVVWRLAVRAARKRLRRERSRRGRPADVGSSPSRGDGLAGSDAPAEERDRAV